MKTASLYLLILSLILSFGILPAKASDDVDLPLKQLHQEVMMNTRPNGSAVANGATNQPGSAATVDVQSLGSRFKTVLNNEDFSAGPGAASRIAECADIAEHLLPLLSGNVPQPSDKNFELLEALQIYVNKVSASIDKQWTFQRGITNVQPPDGVPNAAPGMQPEAISNPQLRQQYLNSIAVERAKQHKNNQQDKLRRARRTLLWLATGLDRSNGQQGWSRTDLASHFAPDDESKSILDECMEKAGKSN